MSPGAPSATGGSTHRASNGIGCGDDTRRIASFPPADAVSVEVLRIASGSASFAGGSTHRSANASEGGVETGRIASVAADAGTGVRISSGPAWLAGCSTNRAAKASVWGAGTGRIASFPADDVSAEDPVFGNSNGWSTIPEGAVSATGTEAAAGTMLVAGGAGASYPASETRSCFSVVEPGGSRRGTEGCNTRAGSGCVALIPRAADAAERDRDAEFGDAAVAACAAGNAGSTVTSGVRGREIDASKTNGVGFPVCRSDAAPWMAASAPGICGAACRTGLGDWLRLAGESRSASSGFEKLPSTAENALGEESFVSVGAAGTPAVEPGATSGWLRSLARGFARAADDGGGLSPAGRPLPDSGAAPAGGREAGAMGSAVEGGAEMFTLGVLQMASQRGKTLFSSG